MRRDYDPMDTRSVERTVLLGEIVGVGGLGYIGFRVGEAINSSYEITEPLARYSIDTLSTLAGGGIGLFTGAVAGLTTYWVGEKIAHGIGRAISGEPDSLNSPDTDDRD